MDTSSLISVFETASRELTATGARIVVRISGQSFFTGTEAFNKAAEVATCVAALADCGIVEDDVRLLGVTAAVASGFLTKSSSATYDLEVKIRSMDLLASAIAAISSQKSSTIITIAWDYPELAATKKEVLQEAVRAAYAAAKAIADTLAISVLGIQNLSYDVIGLDIELEIPGRPVAKGRAVKAVGRGFTELATGLNFSHTTQLAVAVKADFLVGMFSNGM